MSRAIVPLLLLAALYFAVFGGEYSVFEVRATRAQVEVERARLAEVSSQIDSLGALADSLTNDPATIERVAREEYGMVREGETLYRFADAEAGATAETAPAR